MKRVPKNYNSIILAAFSERPIAFNRTLAKIVKRANGGLLMSQLLYWWNKGYKPGWIYKTIKEIESETALTRSEQDTAIRAWKRLGVLETKNAGIPPKRHFKINLHRLGELISKELGRPIPDLQEVANQFAREHELLRDFEQNNTENTPEKTFKDCSIQEPQTAKFKNEYGEKRRALANKWRMPSEGRSRTGGKYNRVI